jgi:hypothetical protein
MADYEKSAILFKVNALTPKELVLVLNMCFKEFSRDFKARGIKDSIDINFLLKDEKDLKIVMTVSLVN